MTETIIVTKPYTDYDLCGLLVKRLSKWTGIDWSFGYLGNLYWNGDDNRQWYAFANDHPGRVATDLDHIGGTDTPAELVPILRGAVSLAIVLSYNNRLNRWKDYRDATES